MPAEIEPIRDAFGLPVIEDAAQALGAASTAAASARSATSRLSRSTPPELGAFGDGGAITTDDDDLAERVRALRFHGSRDKQSFQYVGYNSRLDEIQAAILRVLLPHLDAWCDGRRAVPRPISTRGSVTTLSLVAPRWAPPPPAPVRGDPH